LHLAAQPVGPRDEADQHVVVPRLRHGGPSARRFAVAELDLYAAAARLGGRCGERPHGLRGASLPTDDAAEVAGGHEDLHDRHPAMLALRHRHGVRTVGQRARDDLDNSAGIAHQTAATSVSDAAGFGWRLTSVRTVSDALAPTPSQYSRRSWSI